MMKIRNLEVLNKKETKPILKEIQEQWDVSIDLDYVFLKSDKNKLFIANREIFDIDFSKIRVNSLGLYFGETGKGIRLTIEGSQIIGPHARKNVVEVDDRQAMLWFKGEDLELQGDYSGFVIIKNNSDYIGTGKYKEGKILNFIPKTRRINPVHG